MCVSTSTHTRCARGRTPQRVCRQPSRSFTVPLLFHRVVVVVVVVVTATDFANSRAFFTRRRPTNTERGWAVVVDPGPWWKWKKHRCLDPAAPRINHGRTTCLLSCHTPTTHTGGSYLNSLSLSLSPPLCSLLAFSFSVNFPFGVFRVPSLDSRFRESTVRCRLLCVGYEESKCSLLLRCALYKYNTFNFRRISSSCKAIY